MFVETRVGDLTPQNLQPGVGHKGQSQLMREVLASGREVWGHRLSSSQLTENSCRSLKTSAEQLPSGSILGKGWPQAGLSLVLRSLALWGTGVDVPKGNFLKAPVSDVRQDPW